MKRIYLLLAFICFACPGFCQQPGSSGPLVQKGSVYTGLTFNFNVKKTEGEEQLLVYIEDRKNNTFNFDLNSGYFLKDNFALGGRLSYAQSRRVGREQDLIGIPSDISGREQDWGIYATMKNYLPLDKNHRFYLYNMVLLGGRISNAKTESTKIGIVTTTETKDKLIELRLVPGLMVNIVKGFCLDLGTDIAGVKSSWSNTTVNGNPTTKKSEVSADLTINLLRLSLGFYYYFGVHNNKSKGAPARL